MTKSKQSKNEVATSPELVEQPPAWSATTPAGSSPAEPDEPSAAGSEVATPRVAPHAPSWGPETKKEVKPDA